MLEMSHIYPTRDSRTHLPCCAPTWCDLQHPPWFDHIAAHVPFPEWLSKLSEEYRAQSYSNANLKRTQADNPALRLFSSTSPRTLDPNGSRSALRVWILFGYGTRGTNIKGVSRRCGEENVRKLLSAWCSSGFLPPKSRGMVSCVEEMVQ